MLAILPRIIVHGMHSSNDMIFVTQQRNYEKTNKTSHAYETAPVSLAIQSYLHT